MKATAQVGKMKRICDAEHDASSRPRGHARRNIPGARAVSARRGFAKGQARAVARVRCADRAFLSHGDTAALPQIHCFYEVMSETAQHPSLIAATKSMRAAGHPVRVWSYAPEKLDFLTALGVELRDAADVVPRGLFERIVARSEIRYFSDIFRYAVLYEHGGLWMDTDVVMLRPFPFRGDHFFNLQWRGGHKGHFICGNVMYAEPYSRHLRALYEHALDRFFAERGTEFGDIGPKLLSDYVTSDEGAELQKWLFSPMLFNAIDWTEVDRFNQPVAELADYLNDERVFGIHLWNARTFGRARRGDLSLISLLSDPRERMPSFTTSPTASTPTRTATPATATAMPGSTTGCFRHGGSRCAG